jgi:dUTP pyrophosphatase
MTALTGDEIYDNCVDKDTVVDKELQVQPAGIDMTLRKIEGFVMNSHGTLDFDNSRRKKPETALIPFDIRDRVFLNKGVYLVTVDPITTVPLDCRGTAKPRSSLCRMGATIHSAIWDPGYKGESQFLLEVVVQSGIELYKGARIAQLMFDRLGEETFAYDGVYQGSGLKD